jgi:competence ComEA-like helix-hairpin-helix protein
MAKIPLRAYIREIEEMIEREHYEEAIAHCRHILQFYPKHLDTYRTLGKTFLEAKRYSDAADILQRVLSSLPGDFIANLGMSIIREDEGNMDEAIWHMERAFEVQPANSAIQAEMRRLYGRRDGIEPPKVRLTRGALSRMYFKGGLYQQAIAEIRAALAEEPGRADLQALLASVYFLSGMRVEAAEVCNTLLKKLPYCFDANRILAEILANTEHAQEAQTYRERTVALDPYAAFLSPGAPTPEQVGESSVMVEKLDWRPGNSPASSLAWAATLGVAMQPEKPAEEPIPEWMREAGWGPATGEAEETSLAISEADFEQGANGAAGEAEATDLPVWLRSMAPEDLEGEAGADLTDLDIPEFLAGDLKPEEAADAELLQRADPAAPTELPDWLKEFEAEAEPLSEGELANEDLPDWLAEGAETAQPAEESDLPDWLREISPAAAEESQAAPELEASETPFGEPDEALDPGSELSQAGEPELAPLSVEEEDAAFAWLEGLAARQGANEALLLNPEDRLETPPDWVQESIAGEQAGVELGPEASAQGAAALAGEALGAGELEEPAEAGDSQAGWLAKAGAAAAAGAILFRSHEEEEEGEPSGAEIEPEATSQGVAGISAEEPRVAEQPETPDEKAEPVEAGDSEAGWVAKAGAAAAAGAILFRSHEQEEEGEPSGAEIEPEATAQGAPGFSGEEPPEREGELAAPWAPGQPETRAEEPETAEAGESLPEWLAAAGAAAAGARLYQTHEQEEGVPAAEIPAEGAFLHLDEGPVIEGDTQPTRVRPAEAAVTQPETEGPQTEAEAILPEGELPADEWILEPEKAPETQGAPEAEGVPETPVSVGALEADGVQEIEDQLEDGEVLEAKAESETWRAEETGGEQEADSGPGLPGIAAAAVLYDTFKKDDEETLVSSEEPAPLMSADDEAAAFAWLESLAARQGAEEALLLAPEERLDTPPEWVQEAILAAEEEAGTDTEVEAFAPVSAGAPPLSPDQGLNIEVAQTAGLEEKAPAEAPLYTEELSQVLREDEAWKAQEGAQNVAERPEARPEIGGEPASQAPMLQPEGEIAEPEAGLGVAGPEVPAALEPAAPEPAELVEQAPAEAPISTEELSQERREEQAWKALAGAASEAERPEVSLDTGGEAGEGLPLAGMALGAAALGAAALRSDEPDSASEPPETEEGIPELPSWLSEVDEGGEAEEASAWTPPEEGRPRPLIDLNRAALNELERLPGIGFIRAQTIIQHRERAGNFTSVDDLLTLPGFDPDTVTEVKGYLFVEAPTPASEPGAFKPADIAAFETISPEQVTLIQARNALTQGNREEALGHYDSLIRTERLLAEVIQDLHEALYRFPVEVDIWQALGDAYMRSDKLKEALDAYTKAEELLR